ncbi:hypothetical protein JB92DRAFT_3098936, partial [Gautieria morchelliformis]
MGISRHWINEDSAVYDTEPSQNTMRLPTVDGLVPQAPVPGAPYSVLNDGPSFSGANSYGLQKQEFPHTGREPLIEDEPTEPVIEGEPTVREVDSYNPTSGSRAAGCVTLPTVNIGRYLHQEGASFPSAGPDCSSAFMPQDLHYTA